MHHYRAFTQFAALLSPIEAERKRNAWTMASTVDSCNCKKRMEARVGIEPTYKGFADLFCSPLKALLSAARFPFTQLWAKFGPTHPVRAPPVPRGQNVALCRFLPSD